jgi:16S rRNA (guanine527-N7)-methyltransferase
MSEAAARLTLLARGAEAMGVRLDADQLHLLDRHIALLLKWNRSINLTAITDPAEVVEKHVLDSLAVAPFVPRGTLLDAGSGGGFPGLPLRIVHPELEVFLVDSVQKKVAFLKSVLAELRLPNVRALAVRLEGKPAEEGLPRVNGAIARAFAGPRPWLQLASQYVLPGGLVLCMLGPSDEAPAAEAGLELVRELAYKLPFSGAQRRLLLYEYRSAL